jgi:hypothetical protein
LVVYRLDLPLDEDGINIEFSCDKCPTYKRNYKGIRFPQCGCKACWKKYFDNHPEDLTKLIESLEMERKAIDNEIKTMRELCDHNDSTLISSGNNWNGWDQCVDVTWHKHYDCNICGEHFTEETTEFQR